MNSIVRSAVLATHHAVEIGIEAFASENANAQLTLVGLPDASVRETAQRIVPAFKASGLPFSGGIAVLAPNELEKNGSTFDLPIALALASTSSHSLRNVEDCCIVGELASDGTVRGIKGAIAVALESEVPRANPSACS